MAKTITINRFLGLDKRNRFSLSPEYAMSTKNLTSDKFPFLTTRLGQLMLATQVSKVLGIGIWKDTEVHVVFSDGSWRKNVAGVWTTLATGLNASARWTFTNFDGAYSDIFLIGTNGVDGMKKYNGTTVANIVGAPVGAKYVTQFADRLWCIVGNELKASAYRNGDDWSTVTVPESDTDSWFSIIETPDGEQICGLKAGMTKLVIAKPSSIHELYGYAPSDYTVRPVTFDIGAINNECMIVLNGVLFLLDSTGLYAYGGGTIPEKRFSVSIQDYIDNINQTAKNLSAIGTDGNKLYVSIPVTSSTTPDTVIEFDPKEGTFYPWDSMNVLCFAQQGANFYMGDNNGKVNQLTGSTDNSVAISYEWISKPFVAPSMAQLVRWHRAWLTAHVPTGSTLTIYISPTDSGDDWTLVKTITANGVVESTSMYMSAITQATNARYMRVKFAGTGPVDIYEFTREEEYTPLK